MNKTQEKQLPHSYNLYDSVYGSDFPAEQYFVFLFDHLPSKHVDSNNYDASVINYFLSNNFVEVSKVYSTSRRYDKITQSLYINKENQLIVRVFGNEDKTKNNLVQIDFLYNIMLGDIEGQIDFLELRNYERKRKKSNIHLIKSEMGHLDTQEYDIHVPPMDLLLNYGESFLKIHEVINNRINKENDKGIILLHGDPGTGKTSYIKYLTSIVKEKDILFIPPSMAEMLSEPSIIPFLMDHKNSILIIEDAERVISDREINGSPAGVSNILNLTDGILGDCLNIQIVATFNMKREKIDKALLRKGRLIVEHKFSKLSVNDTNKLLKHLEKNITTSEEMCLADIYNIDVELFKSTNKTNKIGF
jgi:hypothetical protein